MNSQMNTSQTSFCHSGSIENYFNSPKMPVRDHIEGLKSTCSSFKHTQSILDKVNEYETEKTIKILGEETSPSISQLHNILTIQNMKLMKNKELHIVNHQSGKENANIGSHHDRQTNSGFSRNKLGGFFTS